ncbi:MAG TPA: glycosyltransferase family 4 protein [Candidatus Margulisiibacteriota bacterium]|nr:glycosyltransferase family 4 protein [Candidatus Margulisiibacteriota bacterium]
MTTDHRPRVLHVGPLPPSLGGVAAALQMILRCPALAGFEQRAFNVFRGGRPEIAGRKVPTPGRVLRRLALTTELARQVRHERPDILHFHFGSESTLDSIGALLMMRAGSGAARRTILHVHVDPATADLPGRGALGQRLFRQLTRQVDAICVLTDGYREHLLRCAVPQPVSVVPNMCDEQLLALSIERQRGTDGVCVVALGRLTREKGFFDLLQVATRLGNTRPAIRFEVAGLPASAAEARRIDEIVESAGLRECVRLPGAVLGADKTALFARADVLVAPSYWESFGLTAIEGMAAGLPVVGTAVAGLKNIIVDQQTGFLVAPGDIGAMQRCLTQLAGDSALRLRMGASGRQRFLDRYSAARVGASIATLYQQLLEAPAVPHRRQGVA